ncbi:diguanylate cyclase [Persephonella sp.]
MSEKIKGNILIIDDTESNIDILMEILGDDFEIYAATDGETGLEIINEEDIDLVLLDIMMPDMDGFEVCRKLKENHRTEDIPVIFITALTDEESIEKAFDVGGSDYITKPFKHKEVLARVKMHLKLKYYQEELKKLASTDFLTGLYNRRHMFLIGNELFEISKRYNKKLSVIILDIDRFKSINDTYGHDAGDEALKALSQIIIDRTRECDVPARLGGEEFVILLPETELEGAKKLAEDLRQAVENEIIELPDGQKLSFTVSIGVSEINLSKDLSFEKALKLADKALYEAKETGRNKVIIKENT